MKKLLIIGSVHTELRTYVKALPKGNEEAEILSQRQTVSGGGYQAGRCFRMLGFPFTVICDPGEGVYGDFAREGAAELGIELAEGSGEIGGCTFRMIDPAGNDAAFCVDGSEYHFSITQVYDIDPDEYGAAAVYAEMLSGEGAEELVDVLRELEMPLYLIFGEKSRDILPEALEALKDLSPVMIMDESDAFDLNGAKERPDTIAQKLSAETRAAVMILSGSGVLYCSPDDTWVAPCSEKPQCHVWAAYCIAAFMAGVDRRNGMMFANEASAGNDPAAMKQRLAGMILHR